MSKRKKKEIIIDENMPADGLEWLEHVERIKAAIPTIDPETAEITCCSQAPDDPYGGLRDHGYPTWKDIVVPVYYARAPGSDDKPFSAYGKFARERAAFNPSKVWLGDLPEPVQKALIEKRKGQLREAALAIDPETAEVGWDYVIAGDPYCFTAAGRAGRRELNLNRDYFAWAPESITGDPETNLWVWFGDLPEAVRDALWKKHDLPGNGEFKEKN